MLVMKQVSHKQDNKHVLITCFDQNSKLYENKDNVFKYRSLLKDNVNVE